MAKRKRNRKLPAIETSSVRPCLTASQPASTPVTTPCSFNTSAPLSSPSLPRSSDFTSLLSGLTLLMSHSGTAASATLQGQVIVEGNVVNLAVSTRVPLPTHSTPPVFTSASCSRAQNTQKSHFS